MTEQRESRVCLRLRSHSIQPGLCNATGAGCLGCVALHARRSTSSHRAITSGRRVARRILVVSANSSALSNSPTDCLCFHTHIALALRRSCSQTRPRARSAPIRAGARRRRSVRSYTARRRTGPRSSRKPASRSIHDSFRLPRDIDGPTRPTVGRWLGCRLVPAASEFINNIKCDCADAISAMRARL